jgi:hypothetical protein
LEKSYPLPLKRLKLVQWFWRKKFLNDPNPFLHFCDYLSLEEDLALHLNKLGIPFTQG